MSVFSPPVAIEKLKSGQGGGVHPPGFGGGDDNGPGDSSPDYGRRNHVSDGFGKNDKGGQQPGKPPGE